MDDLVGCKGTLPADREAQFLRLRERIEHIASTIFDEKTVLEGAMIRIFWKHIENDRFALSITVRTVIASNQLAPLYSRSQSVRRVSIAHLSLRNESPDFSTRKGHR
jgi:hypothetical protein